mgnify:CR=1 FL=1|jgi:hypothetical protein
MAVSVSEYLPCESKDKRELIVCRGSWLPKEDREHLPIKDAAGIAAATPFDAVIVTDKHKYVGLEFHRRHKPPRVARVCTTAHAGSSKCQWRDICPAGCRSSQWIVPLDSVHRRIAAKHVQPAVQGHNATLRVANGGIWQPCPVAHVECNGRGIVTKHSGTRVGIDLAVVPLMTVAFI